MHNKQNDVSVLSLSTQESLKINLQIGHITVTDSEGEHSGPDELTLVFSAMEPIPIDEREPCSFDPNEPLVVALESKEQTDHLIRTLQKLRNQIWGFSFIIEKN